MALGGCHCWDGVVIGRWRWRCRRAVTTCLGEGESGGVANFHSKKYSLTHRFLYIKGEGREDGTSDIKKKKKKLIKITYGESKDFWSYAWFSTNIKKKKS